MKQSTDNLFEPRLKKGANTMNIVEKHEALSSKPLVTDRPLFLWMEQKYRKFLGKPLLQEEVLDNVVTQAIRDENLIGILLFGSVASNTHTWKSDIDLIFIYIYTCNINSCLSKTSSRN